VKIISLKIAKPVDVLNLFASIALRPVGLQQLLQYDVIIHCCKTIGQTLAMWLRLPDSAEFGKYWQKSIFFKKIATFFGNIHHAKYLPFCEIQIHFELFIKLILKL